jgi:ATP-dependent DNA ligase
MKYWAPPKGNPIVSQILANPEKFSHYTFTPKMDGEWNKLMWDGEHMYMLARARNVQGVFTDRWEKFPHIIEELKDLPKNTILLGEMAFEDITKTCKDVGSIMRSLVPLALSKQKEDKNKLHFYIFDCLMWDGEELSDSSYQRRFIDNRYTTYYFDFVKHCKYVHLLKPQPMTELLSYLEDYFARGGEGVVLIDRETKYIFGSRPVRASVKIKKQLDEFEAKVIRTLEPNQKYEGTEIENWKYFKDGAAVTKPYFNGWKNGLVCEYEGRTFSVTSGLNDEDRAWLATDAAQESISAGKLYAVCGAMELTPDSVRHPYLSRMRDDM